MTENPESMTRRGWLLWVAFGFAGLMSGLCICWIIRVCPPPPTPHLLIQDDDIAAWMTINNTFTVREVGGVPVYDRDLRAGVLIQVGEYDHGEAIFKEVVLKNGTTVVDTYAKGDFTWINVVSPWTKPENPMDPGTHEFFLYPNTIKTGGKCAEVEACVNKSFLCDPTTIPKPQCHDPARHDTLLEDCLRGRLLHWGFDLSAIITYWEGPKGFSLAAAQNKPVMNVNRPGQKRNDYAFTFVDAPFTVDIYKSPPVAGGSDLVRSYKLGEVTRIEVNADPNPKGPNHGNHQTPPWIPPEP